MLYVNMKMQRENAQKVQKLHSLSDCIDIIILIDNFT